MIEFTTTDRGFKHPAPIAAQWGGQVKVIESSNAMEACLWLIVSSQLSTAPGKVELTLAQAEILVETLRWTIDNHYQQGDPH